MLGLGCWLRYLLLLLLCSACVGGLSDRGIYVSSRFRDARVLFDEEFAGYGSATIHVPLEGGHYVATSYPGCRTNRVRVDMGIDESVRFQPGEVRADGAISEMNERFRLLKQKYFIDPICPPWLETDILMRQAEEDRYARYWREREWNRDLDWVRGRDWELERDRDYRRKGRRWGDESVPLHNPYNPYYDPYLFDNYPRYAPYTDGIDIDYSLYIL